MNSPLRLGFDEQQLAVSEAITRFCEQHDVETLVREQHAHFPTDLWRQLAALGVFAPAAPGHSDSGGAVTVCAISEALGHVVFPGPIADTFLALQVLDGSEFEAILCGDVLICVSRSDSQLLPLGTVASLFLQVEDACIFRATPRETLQPIATLGGETWARGALATGETLSGAPQALTLGNLSQAAYIAALGLKLLSNTAEYVAQRQQFGQPLGDFQAISHPLADCMIALSAAQRIARAAARDFDELGGDHLSTQQQAAGAIRSARRAGLMAAHTCHQAYGAIGVTLEGPVFHCSRRLRQLASLMDGQREEQLLVASAGLRGH
ncbi:MAG: acyl-CoA dehydrogenase [Pseudomonadota bacterium]